MKKGLMGRKIGMTQVFTEDGTRIPVTVVEAEPNVVVALRTPEKDGYAAVQLGYGEAKKKHLTRPEIGHLEKAGGELRRHLREVRVDAADLEGLEPGAAVRVDIFEPGMKVDVTAISKGKGFQGVMKRHGMAGMRATHGTHEKRRNPGSIGQRKTPGRTFKNKRLPGHMGHKRVTTQNLVVVEVDAEQNVLLVKGTIPGSRGALVLLRPAVKGSAATKAA
jgi:large subunit ribosomal protein L3